VLGALLAIIGCLGLAYALVTTVRFRAQEFATLKTLGFRRGQVVSTVAVQATLLAGLGVLVGGPLGVFLGRLVWQRVAEQAGMASETTISILAVAGVAIVTVVVANLVAGIPARRAAQLRPAVVLRSE
jgi:putative ABC transport system permease protein